MLKNYPPLSTGLIIVAVLIAVVTFSVGGLNRRGLATFMGSMLGVLMTCGLAVWFVHLFRLHGAVRPFAETLLYSGYYYLNLTDMIIASIFIAKGLPSSNILNAPFVAAEVLNILVGSFGLITVAPFTAAVAGLLYKYCGQQGRCV